MLALEKLYDKPSSSNKVFLMKHLFIMKMLERGYVVDHLNEFNTVTDQLSYVGDFLMMKLGVCYFYAHFQKVVMV